MLLKFLQHALAHCGRTPVHRQNGRPSVSRPASNWVVYPLNYAYLFVVSWPMGKACGLNVSKSPREGK
jgi:hypothetical protein